MVSSSSVHLCRTMADVLSCRFAAKTSSSNQSLTDIPYPSSLSRHNLIVSLTARECSQSSSCCGRRRRSLIILYELIHRRARWIVVRWHLNGFSSSKRGRRRGQNEKRSEEGISVLIAPYDDTMPKTKQRPGAGTEEGGGCLLISDQDNYLLDLDTFLYLPIARTSVLLTHV